MTAPKTPPMVQRPISFNEDSTVAMKAELMARYDELSTLEKQQVEIGTTVPNLYGSWSRFVANPSTVGVETFQRMIDTDETIGSGVDFMILSMVARFGKYTHPIPEIENFIRRAIDQMDGSWQQNLIDMFSAEWAGFSTSEIVWKFDRDFDGFPAFVPQKLVTYPPLTMVYAVDQNGEILPDGIYQYQRYQNTSFSGGGFRTMGPGGSSFNGFRPDLYASAGDMPYPVRIAADVSLLATPIPRDKCVHLTSSVTGSFRSPYGKSPMRRMYKNWVMKDAFLKMWIVAADRRGTPLIVGYAPANDTLRASESTQQTRFKVGEGGPNPQGRKVRADQALADALSKIHNSSFVVLPGKKDDGYAIDSVQVSGDMNVFKDGIEYVNKALLRGLLIPPLMMSAGDGSGSYALGQTHDTIWRSVIDGKNKVHQHSILQQFIRPIIAYNFPRKLWEKEGVGSFLLEDFDPDVMEKLANIFGAMTDRGFLSEGEQMDFDWVRQRFGAPMRPITERDNVGGVEEEDIEGSEGADDNPAANQNQDPLEAVSRAVDELENKMDGEGDDEDNPEMADRFSRLAAGKASVKKMAGDTDETKGRWVTMNGAHVFIKGDGEPSEGSAAGKKIQRGGNEKSAPPAKKKAPVKKADESKQSNSEPTKKVEKAPEGDAKRGLGFYTGSLSTSMIEADKSGKSTPENDAFNAWISEQKTFEKPIYRGLAISKDSLEKYLEDNAEGKEIELPAKQSFTKDRAFAEQRIRHVNARAESETVGVVIEYPAGGPGVDISKYSRFEEEGEVVVPKGTKYRIAKVSKGDDGSYVIQLAQTGEAKEK